ncbi:MAG TPA: IS3 family transposase [Pseudomonadales bacterium]|nr:IS3 family transposase [Pseudomonadales bacterium]
MQPNRSFNRTANGWLTLRYATYSDAELDIAHYIRYYNYVRGHSYNNYLSPVAAEAA